MARRPLRPRLVHFGLVGLLFRLLRVEEQGLGHNLTRTNSIFAQINIALALMNNKTLIDLARYIRELTPTQRVEAIEALRQLSRFCWSCGRDLGDTERCHCENDE